MSENLTSRIKIGFTEEEKKKYEMLAQAHGLTFAGLVRYALDFYERKGDATKPNGDDKIAKLLEKQEQRYNELLARIDEKIAQFQPSTKDPTPDRAEQMQVIENIVRAHPDGVTTGVIVKCTPTTWGRPLVTEILLELKSAGKLKRQKDNWSVV